MNWLIIGLFKYLIKHVQKSQKSYLLLIIFKSIDKILKKKMWLRYIEGNIIQSYFNI